MFLVRLYGNSWKWQLLRRCFAEWIIRMDQFGEMSKTKQVVPAEMSRSGASGKQTINILFDNIAAQTRSSSRVVIKGLSGSLMSELWVRQVKATGLVSVLFMNAPM